MLLSQDLSQVHTIYYVLSDSVLYINNFLKGCGCSQMIKRKYVWFLYNFFLNFVFFLVTYFCMTSLFRARKIKYYNAKGVGRLRKNFFYCGSTETARQPWIIIRTGCYIMGEQLLPCS